MLDAIQDAILLVDRDLRVRHANAAARAMLDAGKAICLRNGRLEVNDPKADAKLARILAGECGGELRPTGPALPGVTIQIHPCVEALGGAWAAYRTIRITDLNRERELPTPARLRDRLGLTSRQAEVAAELARGVTEAEAAAKLSLGAPTLHTHVRRIYEKLDLRSRAELMALLARQGFHATLRPK
jgi:DNA-binding CsgD family transcriptional regulator